MYTWISYIYYYIYIYISNIYIFKIDKCILEYPTFIIGPKELTNKFHTLISDITNKNNNNNNNNNNNCIHNNNEDNYYNNIHIQKKIRVNEDSNDNNISTSHLILNHNNINHTQMDMDMDNSEVNKENVEVEVEMEEGEDDFIETLKQFENADINSLKAFITSTSEEIYE